MERWLQITLGTIFGSVGVIVFYIIFEKFLKTCKGSRRPEKPEGINTLELRVRPGAHALFSDGDREEMENLVYEEYDTEDHEVLALVLETEQVSVGVSLFLSDRIVEYYWTRFPECCIKHTGQNDVSVRSFVTCLSVWAEKWTLAECVNILSQNEQIVRNVGTQDSELWRKANQFESKHDFKLYTQWTENYYCDEVASEGLWSELITLGRKLLKTNDDGGILESEQIWESFPVQHWKRKRVVPKSEHFHSSVPHPGEITPPLNSISTIAVTDNLVNL